MPIPHYAPRRGPIGRIVAAAASDRRPLAIGLICIAAAAGTRLAIEQVVGGILPFLFTFPAVIAATLLSGASGGWIALLGCQALSYAFVLPHWLRGHDPSQAAVTLLLSSVSGGAAVWATDAFQRASERLRHLCQEQVGTLSLLIAEMDHRTKNNFQIAASLLGGQALAAEDERSRLVLEEAANRLISIASVYESLSSEAVGHDLVSLRAHLERICAALRASLLPPAVTLVFDGAEVLVPSSTALPVGLIANEWITNAVKHAFAGGSGTVTVGIACGDDEVRVEVADDGVGLAHDAPAGSGARLVPSLVATIGGRAAWRNDGGTVRSVAFARPRQPSPASQVDVARDRR